MIFTSCITTNLISSKISNASPDCHLQSLKSKQTTSAKVITEISTLPARKQIPIFTILR